MNRVVFSATSEVAARTVAKPDPTSQAEDITHISDIASTSHVTITSSGNVISESVF